MSTSRDSVSRRVTRSLCVCADDVMEGACGCARAETETRERTANPTCDEPDVREVRSSRMREMVMLLLMAHALNDNGVKAHMDMVRCRVLILEFRYYCLRGRRHVRRRHLTHSTSNAQVLTGHDNG